MDQLFTRVAGSIALFAGQPLAFVIALVLIIVWGVVDRFSTILTPGNWW
jgi:low affinity Fe/Cu permease